MKNKIPFHVLSVLTVIATALICTSGYGQITVSGKVRDAETKAGIPFVHLAAEGEARFGGVSNVDGYYRFAVPSNTPSRTEIVLSCVGYERVFLPLEQFLASEKIEMRRKPAELGEVVVQAKDDPGYEIMRRAAANRKQNDPESLPGFRLRTYNKAGLDTDRTEEIQAELDSTGFKNARFFFMESSTDLVYKRPGRWNETVQATKMSGIRNPVLSVISNSFQPFATYGDHINLMEKDFLNPVSPGSRNKYVFELADSALVEGTKVYVVRYTPRSGVTGNLLTGSVTVDAQNYAIVHFRGANTTDLEMFDFEIIQNYGKIDGFWFPKESKALYTMNISDPDGEDPDMSMHLYSSTFLQDIDLTYLPGRKDFNVARVRLADGAGSRDELTWQAIRGAEADSADLNTYAVWDTLPSGAVNALNWFMEQSGALAAGRVTFGKFDVLLERILRVNRYENLRLGAGISTNRNLVKFVSLEGWFGYGFGDHRMKYGGGAVFHLSRSHAFDLALRYRNDVDEPGREVFDRDYSFATQGFAIRNLFTEIMNPVEEYSAVLSVRPVRGIKLDGGLAREERMILPGRVFENSAQSPYSIINTSWHAALQWVPGESLMEIGNVLVPTAFVYPRLRLRAEGGIPDVLEGSQDYFRADAELTYAVRLRRAGMLQLFGGAGKIWGDGVAFPYLNFGRGVNNEEDVGLEAPTYFQTMRLYDFMTDEYAYAGFRHNFGTVFGIDGKYSKPKLKIAYSAGIGNLRSSNEQRAPVPYRRMVKPYLEAGVVIDEIIRFKLNRTSANYTALGFGSYLLHGHYAAPRTADNLALIVSIANSF